MKRKSNILAFILILGFAFNFAHSELGFMTPDGDTSHYAHDFCQLTNATTSTAHQIDSRLTAQKNFHSYPPVIFTIPVVLNEHSNAKYKLLLPPHSPASDTPLNIINRTLLI